jgi:nitronate monooxygenase
MDISVPTGPLWSVPILPRLGDLSRWPVVVAPMAGGPSTVELVVAAAEAGALGYLAGGYKTPDALQTEIDAVRTATRSAFGVNLFVPGRPTTDPDAVTTYVDTLAEDAEALGTGAGAPEWDNDAYDEKLKVVLAHPPSIVTFTFGCPSPDVVSALHDAGVLVGITVTTPGELTSALDQEADCICLQGSEAGAHRGSFTNDDRPDQDLALDALLPAARHRTDVPLIGAGGISTPDDVVAALAAGATQVQLGTAFLRCTESGAHPVYKDALADPRFTRTATTRAFSGRRARALQNSFTREHADAPAAYPEINNATRPVRAAAAQQNDPDRMSLYAGEGFRRAEARSAGEIIERLVSGLPS